MRLKICFEFLSPLILKIQFLIKYWSKNLPQTVSGGSRFWSNTVLTNYFSLVFRHHLLWILSIIWWYWKKAEKIEWIGLVKSCSLYIGLHVQKALVNPACNSHSIQDRISHSTQASLPAHYFSFSDYLVQFFVHPLVKWSELPIHMYFFFLLLYLCSELRDLGPVRL